MTDLVNRTTLGEVIGYRDASLAKMKEAVETITMGFLMADEAKGLAEKAHNEVPFVLNDRSQQETYRNLFQQWDPKASFDVFREHTDAQVWMRLLQITGMETLMDKTAKSALYDDLCANVPEVIEENVLQTFERLQADAKLIFQRGLATAFSDLDRRFKSHDGFKIGSRIILTNVFDSWGCWNFHARMQETLIDIERVFAVLDGQKADPYGIIHAISKDREGGLQPHQSVTESKYFRVRCYKNGNAHLWFTRDDLVEKANLVLADYYGEVLPDAAPHPDEVRAEDIKSQTAALSKDLQFYPTPDAVVAQALRDLRITKDDTVLEPSAGTGNMVRWLLSHTDAGHIEAIEVDPGRAAQIPKGAKVTTTCANFLAMRPRAIFDYVVMNPPFYGTHWMEHVVHAFEFLQPGGTLVAILPISAELGSTRKHEAFREWAEQHFRGWGSLFADLPPESFAESGTRINTVVLTLHRS